MSDGYNYPDYLYRNAVDQAVAANLKKTLVEYPDSLYHDAQLGRKEPDTKKPDDPVNHPSHYTGGEIECIDAIKSALSHVEYIGFLKAQVMKYGWRNGRKGDPVEDAAKGLWYQKRLHTELQSEKSKRALSELVAEGDGLGLYDRTWRVNGSGPDFAIDYSDNAYLACFGPNVVANVRDLATTTATSQHPMAAEARRLADEA